MYIRKAKPEDLDRITALEAACFPAACAAPEASLKARIEVYPECFWLGFDDFNELLCYAAGPVTAARDLSDDMYADASCHAPEGEWQMIFSVCTHPDHRREGIGAWLLQRVIMEARDGGRQGIVLTCREEMIHYYERFGFFNEGLSSSAHGGEVWYQMRMTFDEDYFYEHLFDISDDPKENKRMFEEALWGMQF